MLQRLASRLGLASGSRVLELGVGEPSASVFLAREVGCEAVGVSPEAARVDRLRESLQASGVAGKVEARVAELERLGLREADFDAILVMERHLAPFTRLLQTLRPLLRARGKLCITYPVKVGRFPMQVPLDLWAGWLGEPLMYPRDLLGLTVQQGLEPEWAESLSDLELDELYRGAELIKGLPEAEANALQEEISMHRSQAGRSSVTFAMVVARRKEPGEKPPASRDRG